MSFSTTNGIRSLVLAGAIVLVCVAWFFYELGKAVNSTEEHGAKVPKLVSLQLIFAVIEFVSAIPLAMNVFVEVDSSLLAIDQIVHWVGTIGTFIFVILNAVRTFSNKKD